MKSVVRDLFLFDWNAYPRNGEWRAGFGVYKCFNSCRVSTDCLAINYINTVKEEIQNKALIKEMWMQQSILVIFNVVS